MPCPYSDWATVAQTWPEHWIGLWARYEGKIVATASDNFERASLESNWSTPSGVNGGQILSSSDWQGTVNNADNISIWSANTFGVNQYSKAVIGVSGSGDAGVVLHMQDNGAGYACDYYDGAWYLQTRSSAGSYSTIGTYTVSSPGNGTIIELRVNGNNIEFYLNGTLRINVTNTTYRSGQPGVYSYYNTTSRMTIESWEGGDIETLAKSLPMRSSINSYNHLIVR